MPKTQDKITLLQQLLPFGFEECVLANKSKFIKNKCGCILFVDIVSYCELAEKRTDVTTYLILNKIYTMFDTIIEKYENIQKIETIGDAYMVVGNINTFKDETNLYLDMINFSFELIHLLEKEICNNKINIRIGIHSGSYIVCLLGNKNSRLCIVGKNVNKTARLQSTSEINKIHISEEFYNKIPKHIIDKYIFDKKENVFLKNIGYVNTYMIIPTITPSL
jgi:class 3 adenylate cyclase